MKTIKAKTLNEFIRIIKKYYRTGDTDLFPKKLELAEQLSKQAFETEANWLAFCDLVGSVIGGSGLKRNATNKEIYAIFELLGVHVEEAEEETK